MTSSALAHHDRLEMISQSQSLAEHYSLSTRNAAKRLGVSAPTLLKLSRQSPDLLPRLAIPTGQRKLYRFAPENIDSYRRNHMRGKHEH